VSNHMDPTDQNPPVPADAGAAAPPAAEPIETQPVPQAHGAEGAQPAQGGAVETPPAEGAPAPSDDAATQQSRQERRNAEREQRNRELANQVQQGVQPNQQPAGQPQSPQGFDVTQYADAEGNLDINATNQAFQQNVVQTADAIATLRVEQQLAHRDAVNNFQRDTDTIPTKFKELDPNSDLYTEELDAAIAADFQERAFKPVINPQTGQPFVRPDGKPVMQLDTSVRLADIAERHVKSARSLAQKYNANSNAAVDAAADSAAPRPSGAKPTERKFEDLTLAEMKAKVGYHKV
jgi:hypothetical protein